MALAAPFPPWLNIKPETFTGAMESGGRLGVMALAQDVKSQQAADRLQLAYDQLAAKEKMASEALQGKLALGEQQMQYKQDAMDLRNQFQQAGLSERERHNLQMEGLGMDRLKLGYESAKARLQREAAKSRSVSDWQKLLNDLHYANQTGNEYDKQVLLQALEGRLVSADPAVKLKAGGLLRTIRTAREIEKGGNLVDPKILRKYREDEQKALQELEDLFRNRLPELEPEGTPTSSTQGGEQFPELQMPLPWEKYTPPSPAQKLAENPAVIVK